MQMGKREWMQLLEDEIISLIHSWEISLEEGIKYANNPRLIREA
jgi:hypothetical protein